jgi:hypothetical protein
VPESLQWIRPGEQPRQTNKATLPANREEMIDRRTKRWNARRSTSERQSYYFKNHGRHEQRDPRRDR